MYVCAFMYVLNDTKNVNHSHTNTDIYVYITQGHANIYANIMGLTKNQLIFYDIDYVNPNKSSGKTSDNLV